MTRTQIVQAIQREHENLVAALAGISDEMLVSQPLNDRWTLKDLMGHVAMWYRVAIRFIADYKRDGIPKPLGLRDDEAINAYNARGMGMRRTWALNQVRTEFDAAYRDLLAAVQTLSDADLVQPLPTSDWQSGTATLEEMIAVNSYQHEPEHAEQVKIFKEKVKSNSGMQ